MRGKIFDLQSNSALKLGFIVGALMPITGSASELRDLRLLDGPESTRAVLDLDAETPYNIFFLSNPDRLVIDIPGGKRAASLHLDTDGKGVIKDVRTGPHDDGLRVVMDLNVPVTQKSFGLQPSDGYGYRLILDLFSKSGGAAAVTDVAPTPGKPISTAVETVSISAPAPTSTSASVLRSIPIPAATQIAQQRQTATLDPATEVTVKPPPEPLSDKLRLTSKPIVIAVDAGHGGEDPGAHGRGGLQEKNVTLAIAKILARKIDDQPGMRAVLTRDGDYYVGLRERTVKARDAQADLFVSIHANAYQDRDMRGTAVYVLSDHGASTEQARWIANSENSADLVGGVKLQDKDQDLAAVLIDISQSATMDASFDLGGRMLNSLGKVNELQKPAVQQAGFMVLKSPDIPSVLVETAFITNPEEERLLGNPGYQEKLATSIFEGIRGYFSRYRPLQQVVVVGNPEQESVGRRQRNSGKTIPVSLKTR